MPRVTRAALRSQSNNEESDNTSTAPPPAPTSRLPLGETNGNQVDRSLMIVNPEKVREALNKGIVKGKKSKALNKAKENVAPVGHQNNGDVVLRDDYESETSSAVDEACKVLISPDNGEISQQAIELDQQSHSSPSPPSPAAELAAEQLSATLRTAEAFSAHHSTHSMDQTLDAKGEQHYDVPPKASSSWPDMARNSSLTVGPHADNSTARNDDSPEGKTPEIISSKSATRIEDSVEALDNLEEEIEMIDDLIPKLADISQPSPSILKGKKGVSNSKAVKQKQLAGEESRKAPATKSSNAVAAVNMETPLNSKKVAAQTASKRPAAIRVASNSTQSSSIQGNSAKKPPSATKKRISSVHKPPFVPAKSSKPPTRSNFELPGEGVARKLKEAREVRLKREEEKPQRKIFKARPVRLSQAPVVRLTAASKARISLAKGEAKETSLKPASTLHQNKLPDGSKAKRQSTLAVAECKGLPSTNPSGRTSGRLSTGATATSGKVSAPRPARTSLSAADAAQSKLKGKEVFNRGRVEQQERNQMRRNQETAAKKARAEAAERGRIASREWAEKQRARRLAAQNSNREIGKGV